MYLFQYVCKYMWGMGRYIKMELPGQRVRDRSWESEKLNINLCCGGGGKREKLEEDDQKVNFQLYYYKAL